jgi:DNA-binding XRE family transcriptional regulator
MGSFQISITPTRRVATRFISLVRRSLLKALMEESETSGLTQTDVAKTIGVHRSVINRELRGMKDITLGRVAELAFSMGREIEFNLVKPQFEMGRNIPKIVVGPISAGENTTPLVRRNGVPTVSTKNSNLVAA